MPTYRGKVVHVTSVHPALDHRIFFKECRSLARAGYRVTLIAPHESSGEVDGVRIRAVPPPATRLVRMTRTMAAVYAAAVDEDADVYHLHDPELMLVGTLLRLRGRRVIYDAHEDLRRQIDKKPWIPKWLRPVIAVGAGAAEKAFSRIAGGIAAATPVIAGRFPPDKTITVRNYPPLPEAVSAAPYPQRPRALVHASSGISIERGAGEMVQAIGLLPEDFEVRLHLVGQIEERLRRRLSAMNGWQRVECLGWRPPADIPRLLGRARVGLNLLHDQRNYREALPTKMYEYMAAGIPIIASDFPEWRRQYEEIGCTLFVHPRDVEQIAESVDWLLRHPAQAAEMGARGREAVEEGLNWAHEEKQLLRLYSKLLARAA